MYIIIDCNNFYASCERLFNPKLENKPIVVLSNNDGCVIARSNEAKKLNIKMGEPFFKIKPMIIKQGLEVFSSNYALYGDLSHRVMTVLKDSWPETEVYSIDEAFLDLSSLPSEKIEGFCDDLQKKVRKHTGIPVSIGIGSTKTLAKLANKIAKTELCVPVFKITPDSSWLSKLSINEIWGVGRQWTKKLNQQGILTVRDLQCADLSFIKNKFSVVLERTILELRGINSINLEVLKPKKSIISSKSFGSMQTDFQPLMEALSAYSERAYQKLRQQGSVVGHIEVFIQSNQFRKDLPQYSNSIGYNLINPTDDLRKIVKCARYCLERIFKSGYHYKKVGIIFEEVSAKNHHQFDMFSSVSEEVDESSKALMGVMDSINHRFGSSSLKLASNGSKKSWVMRKDYSSPSYTTCWDDLPLVK